MEAKHFLTSFLLALVLAGAGLLHAGSTTGGIHVNFGSDGIFLMPNSSFELVRVTVTGPEGAVARKTFHDGSSLFFSLNEFDAQKLIDGIYTYEATMIRQGEDHYRNDTTRQSGNYLHFDRDLVDVASGYFQVRSGSIDLPRPGGEPGTGISAPRNHINEDLWVTGRMAVGDSVENFETIPYETIRLHQNNCQIRFDDSSTSEGFAANDWKIRANDVYYGGANVFAVDDMTNSTTPFSILANAPDHSFYIDAQGEIGLGTSTPSANLHIKDSTSSLINLESVVYSQIWQFGSTSDFVLRDLSHSSNEVFVAAAGAPEYSMTIRDNGNIGLGTMFPAYSLHLIRSGSNASFRIERSGGAQLHMTATSSSGQFGTTSNDPLILIAGEDKIMTLVDGKVGIGTDSPSNLLEMAGGAYCNGSTWVNSSSRAVKEDIQSLSAEEAVDTLKNLAPVKFKYKNLKDEDFIGFIAEDVPQTVAMKDRKSLHTMDIVAVLTKVVQQQQKSLEEQQKQIESLKEEISKIKKER